MKSSKKALAFALAAAMVVTAVPVAPAEAASTAKLSAKSVTVAAGTAKKQSKTIKVTTPSTWKSVKVSAKSNATGTAKVSVSGKTVKVTAVKKGTAKVTVTVTAKKSGKKVSKKLTATAKVVNAGLKVTAPTEVVVGSETKLTTKVCPSASKVTFKSSDDTIATVDENGTVKAVKAGDVTITTTTDYGKTVESKISVKSYVLKDVKQTRYNQIVATVDGDLAALKASDFTIWNDYSTNVHPVKTLSYDKATSTVTLTTYYEKMTDGKTYNVVLNGVTKQFVASDGVITNIGVAPTEVIVGKETAMSAILCDANGVIVKPEVAFNNNVSTTVDGKVFDFTITTGTQGYTTEKGILLYEVGNTATASMKLHTGKYDANGQEVENITGTATIKAIPEVVVTNETFSVKTGLYNAGVKYDTVKETVVAQGDGSDAYNDGAARKAAYISYKKSDGTIGYDLRNYSLESSNLNVLILNNQDKSDNANTTAQQNAADLKNGIVQLTPVLPGTCNIIVRDSKNNVVATLPITVKEKRYAATLKLDKYAVTLSNDVTEVNSVSWDGARKDRKVIEGKVQTNDSATITPTVLDQYGEDRAIKRGNFNYEQKHDGVKLGDNQQYLDSELNATSATVKTAIGASVTAEGTYTGIATYKETGAAALSKTVVTTVKKPGAKVDSYKLELDTASADQVILKDTTVKSVGASVVGYASGVKKKVYTKSVVDQHNNGGDYTNVIGWKLVNSKNDGVAKDAKGIDVNEKAITNTKALAINNPTAAAKIGVDTYTLSATFICGDGDVEQGLIKTVYGSFNVTDSQTAPTVVLKNDGKIKPGTTETDIFSYTYPNATVTVNKINTNDNKITNITQLLAAVNNDKTIMVYSIELNAAFASGNNFNSTVTINHTVSKESNW